MVKFTQATDNGLWYTEFIGEKWNYVPIFLQIRVIHYINYNVTYCHNANKDQGWQFRQCAE